jgi:guanylate kinase
MSEYIVLSGPTGVGKTTLAELLGKVRPSLYRPISCTTRAPKKGEKNGVEYHFLSRAQFERKESLGHFEEYAEIHGDLYGTLKIDLESTDPEIRFLLEIDVQGMRKVRDRFYRVKTVFIHPLSFEVLEERIRARQRGESDEEIVRRLARAREEITCAREFTYEVVNDDLSRALRELVEIVDLPWVSLH